MEKPYFVVNDFALLEQYNLICYTLNGHSSIFVRNIESGMLVAKLQGHKATPIMQLISSALVLVSADASKGKGESVDIRIWRLQEDLLDKYALRPPWIVSSFYQLENAHEAPITSLAYLTRANALVSTSLDSTLKIWKITHPLSLT